MRPPPRLPPPRRLGLNLLLPRDELSRSKGALGPAVEERALGTHVARDLPPDRALVARCSRRCGSPEEWGRPLYVCRLYAAELPRPLDRRASRAKAVQALVVLASLRAKGSSAGRCRPLRDHNLKILSERRVGASWAPRIVSSKPPKRTVNESTSGSLSLIRAGDTQPAFDPHSSAVPPVPKPQGARPDPIQSKAVGS